REAFDKELQSALTTPPGRFDGEFRVVAQAGRSRVIRLIGELESSADGSFQRLMGTAQDLTELVETREQIRTLAYYDSLTGLPNRLLFVDQARTALARARRRNDKTALMVLDLDNFKRINDTLGHDAGDEVLRAVGQRLRDAVRPYDGMTRDSDSRQAPSVARMGGDEFLMSVGDLTDVEQAAGIASRLLDALRQPIALASGPLHVSASIGVSIFPDDGDEFEAILKHADIALYQAKAAGRNGFEFFDRTMNAVALQRLELESSLRDAVQRGTLTIAVQPKVDGRTRALIGGEALLRWDHPVHGAIAPKVFVAQAERIGLASALTTMLVEKVCLHMVAWRDAGLVLVPIAINVAAQVFRDADAVREICRIPLTHNIDPRLIEFEITETALIDDPKRAALVLAELRQNGYRVTLDDFGTGYSSLSHLREFSVDVLKVDGSFVQEVQRNRKDAALVKGIIALAHSLGMETVAEGVESEAQRGTLLSFGCDRMQGYLFGKPTAADEFAQRMQLRRNPAITAGRIARPVPPVITPPR
ncbi:MAG TPA: EAL domain-containing protein, partial [Gemmatimonadaceae bacterium]|nr:EAL domain-containing protein [Gemmatimonadaceae bacterium]